MSKILLVEDNEMMLSLLETLLQMEGFQVRTFNGHSKESLLEILNQEPPDMIMLDVNLSNLNGIDILQSIRQDDQYGHIKILMTSGMDLRASCLQAGADGFLMKPFMPVELINTIRASIPV